MIIIDGSFGTGGGQILRTALGLAVLTGKACKIEKIRAKRDEQGLKEQHLQGALALANLCNATAKGLTLGSANVEFYPQAIIKKHLDINIRTAGSVGLVLQALMIPALQHDLTINIKGGATFGKHAPPLYYIKEVPSYFLHKMGYRYDINIKREGFFPRGGALTAIRTFKPEKLKELIATKQTTITKIRGISVASTGLKSRNVAERQAKTAIEILHKGFKIKPIIDIAYSPSLDFGSGIQLWIETENSRIGGSSLGERSKTAEKVAEEAAYALIAEYKKGAVVDSYAADQLLPYLAITGGAIKTSKITEHAKTNIFVIEKFLPARFSIGDDLIKVKKA